MKKALLVACVLFAQTIYAGDTSDVRSNAVNSDDFRVLIEQRNPEGRAHKYVRIQDQEDEDIVVFPAEILWQSGTIENVFNDCTGKDLLKDIVTLLAAEHAQDLLAGWKIKLLINALGHNEDEEDAKKFVKGLMKDDLVWLAHKAIYWQIDNIKSACQKRLSTKVRNLKQEDLQDPYLRQRIIEQEVLSSCLDQKISDRLSPKTIKLNNRPYGFAALSSDGRQVCIPTPQRVVVYDQKSKSKKTVFRCEDGKEYKSMTFSKDERQLCIATKQRVVIRDQVTGSSKTVFTSQDEESIREVTFSEGGEQLCITTDKRAVVYDQVPGSLKTVFTCQNEESIDEESIDEESIFYGTFSPDGRQLCITTSKKVVVYDQEAESLKTVFTCQNEESIDEESIDEESIFYKTFSQDRRQLCITTSKKVVVYDQETESLKTVFACPNSESICPGTFSEDGGQLCITTSKRVVVYDREEGSLKTVLTCQRDHDVNYFFPKAIFSKGGRQLFVATHRSVVVYDQEAGSLKEILHCQGGTSLLSIIRTFCTVGRKLCMIKRGAQEVILYDPEAGSLKTVFNTEGDECVWGVACSQDGGQLCITTNQRVIILPVLQQQLKDLDLDQINLLLKASAGWDKGQPYELRDDALEVYQNLPDELKREELFSAT